jgi:tetratricopeptide (TPR) repeat protein
LLGENHAESHYNLGLVYERRGLLADAEREMLASLRLNSRQLDARNMLGVIYAEEGKTDRACIVWRELMREVPDYPPARTNLELLGNRIRVAHGETVAAALLPQAAAVKAVEDQRKLPAPLHETALVQIPSTKW